MELPTTIQGFFEVFEKGTFKMPGSSVLYLGMTDICATRLKEIVDIVRELPKDACVQKSRGGAIREYINVCETSKEFSYPYDLRLCFYNHTGDYSALDTVLAHFRYQNGYNDEEGYSTYGTIDIPYVWLICPAEELKKLVLKKVYDDLQDHIYKLRSEVDRVVEAREMLWADFSEYLCSNERKATKEV